MSAAALRRADHVQAIDLNVDGHSLDDLVREVGQRAWRDAYFAPDTVTRRFCAATSLAIADDEQLAFGRVRFSTYSRRFRSAAFDETVGVQWAIMAPMVEGGHVVDVAAFDFDNPERRASLFGGFAVGAESAAWSAHHHPRRRLLVHVDVWSWLRAECVGVVPIDWQQFALWVKAEGYEDILAENDQEAEKIAARVRFALQPPRVFIRNARRAQ